jgi:branched-chain amino acid transport system substrate-binding protein
VHIVAKALEKVGANAGAKELAAAMRDVHQGAMAKYDFSRDDLTGIDLSSYVYSKLTKGKFERLPFTAR